MTTPLEELLVDSNSVQKDENESRFHGYLTVLGGMIMHLYIGNIYLWGNIGSYVVSHFSVLGDASATV